jgi:hypothetical protein
VKSLLTLMITESRLKCLVSNICDWSEAMQRRDKGSVTQSDLPHGEAMERTTRVLKVMLETAPAPQSEMARRAKRASAGVVKKPGK